MIVVGYVVIYVGVLWNILVLFYWMVVLLLGIVVGVIWGVIFGILKVFININEVVLSIMFNYIGIFFVVFLIKVNVYNGVIVKFLNI